MSASHSAVSANTVSAPHLIARAQVSAGTRAVHCKREEFDVYIGRGKGGSTGEWGNPFVIGRDGDRDEVVAKYAAMIRNDPALQVKVRELKGKRLGCFCAPAACHGDVLAWWAER